MLVMPGRTISVELRRRIVFCFFVRHMRITHISNSLFVPRRTVTRLIAQFLDRGTVRPLARRGRRRILDDADMEALRHSLEMEDCTLYLDEMVAWMRRHRGREISVPGMALSLARHGITRKVVERNARERDPVFRAHYELSVADIDSRRLVFIDEIGFNRRCYGRRYGWALASRRAVSTQPFVRGPKYSMITAMNYNGVVAYKLVEGSANAASFMDFLINDLGPHIGANGGDNTVLILDNASIHKSALLRETVALFGARFLFLPPYSPDFNPIELLFGVLKQLAKRHRDMCEADLPRAVVAILSTFTAADCQAFMRHCQYLL